MRLPSQLFVEEESTGLCQNLWWPIGYFKLPQGHVDSPLLPAFLCLPTKYRITPIKLIISQIIAITNRPESAPFNPSIFSSCPNTMNPWGRPCYFQTPNFRFFDRRAFLEKLNCHLRPTQPPSFQAVTLFGEGGVGKSAIAQRYIHDAWCKNEYDAAFWIDCGTTASMSQSFARMAWALGLNGPGPALDDVHWILVRNWLRTTSELFLTSPNAWFPFASWQLIFNAKRLQMATRL